MNSYDQAVIALLAAALVLAVAIFRMRRARGSSRAVATFAAGMGAGTLIAVAILLLYDRFYPPRASIGLERIVAPIVTLFVSLIGSALLAGVVHLFVGRRPAEGLQSVSLDAADILRDARERHASRRRGNDSTPEGDWRAFARNGAGHA